MRVIQTRVTSPLVAVCGLGALVPNESRMHAGVINHRPALDV
jgi:hypothetical protein